MPATSARRLAQVLQLRAAQRRSPNDPDVDSVLTELRLVRVSVPVRPAGKVRAVALCLEPHDLVLAKLAAGRERERCPH